MSHAPAGAFFWFMGNSVPGLALKRICGMLKLTRMIGFAKNSLLLYELLPFLTNLFLFISVGFLLFRYCRGIRRMADFQKRDLKESLAEGGIEEPHQYRDLSDAERMFLESNLKSFRFFDYPPFFSPWFILVEIIVSLVIFSAFGGLFDAFSLFIYLSPAVRLGISFLITLAFLFWLFNVLSRSAREYYYDLKLPVMRVQGSFSPCSEFAKVDLKEHPFLFRVRGLLFSVPRDFLVEPGGNSRRLLDTLSRLRAGDEIAVEYSPYSHHVWNIERVKDI